MNAFQRKDAKNAKTGRAEFRLVLFLRVSLFVGLFLGFAAEAQTNSINLEAVLRLAKAQNLDVQIARARLAEAKAIHESARAQFFPWLSPGISYRRHD